MAINLMSTVTGIVRTGTSQVRGLVTKVRTQLNINKVLIKIRKFTTDFMRKLMKLVTGKPSAKTDYIKIGRTYISKKAVLFGTLIIVGGGYLIINFLYPWADGNLWYAKMQINSTKYSEFSGKAKVYSANKKLIYEGHMENGEISGQGKQYDIEGNLIYKGEFEKSQYSGVGEKLENGVVIYSGNFSQGAYDGEGKLYDSKGNLIYSGSFSVGQKSGNGIEYDALTGLKTYSGAFATDKREGEGIEYGGDGTTVLYEGSFAAGVYSGQGKLYKGGKLLYSGEFANGLYDGEGTLYDISTGKALYKGQFSGGVKQGEGSNYDSLGAVVYNGKYNNDTVDYFSCLGQPKDTIIEQFGKPNYSTETEGKLILTYISLDVSIIFEGDDEGVYACQKVIKGAKGDILGLTSSAGQKEVQDKLGTPFSSVNYIFASYFRTVFSNLSLDLSVNKAAPSDKFVMDNYFVRFYYNSSKTAIRGVEISSI